MKILALFALVACTFLVGCASVPMTTPALDSAAKAFQPEPDRASIYINRKGAFTGGAVIIQTVLDGRIVGSLAPSTYQLLSVAPGEHVLMTSGQFENVQQLKVTAESGRNYFFDASLSMGWALPHVNLKQLEAVEGQKEVTTSKRAEAVTY